MIVCDWLLENNVHGDRANPGFLVDSRKGLRSRRVVLRHLTRTRLLLYFVAAGYLESSRLNYLSERV